jgi:hypothetical protein
MGNYGLVRDVGNYDESVLSLQPVTVQGLGCRAALLAVVQKRLRSQNFVYPPVIDLALAVNVFFGGPHRSITKDGKRSALGQSQLRI